MSCVLKVLSGPTELKTLRDARDCGKRNTRPNKESTLGECLWDCEVIIHRQTFVLKSFSLINKCDCIQTETLMINFLYSGLNPKNPKTTKNCIKIFCEHQLFGMKFWRKWIQKQHMMIPKKCFRILTWTLLRFYMEKKKRREV